MMPFTNIHVLKWSVCRLRAVLIFRLTQEGEVKSVYNRVMVLCLVFDYWGARLDNLNIDGSVKTSGCSHGSSIVHLRPSISMQT